MKKKTEGGASGQGSEILLYQTDDGSTSIEVRLEGETRGATFYPRTYSMQFCIKKEFFLIIVVSFILNLVPLGDTNAQVYHPFANDSAQWSIGKSLYNPWIDFIYQLKMKGDTTIGGCNYKKIYYSQVLDYSWPDDSLHCFLREDTNKRVWVKYPLTVYHDTNEMLLYDFNLEINDTFEVKLLHYQTDSVVKFTVIDKMSTYPTLLDVRTYIQFKALDSIGGVWGVGCDYMWWLDGIGSVLGPLFNEIPQFACYDSVYSLQCYSFNGDYYLGGGTNCEITSIQQEPRFITKEKFLVCPNPVVDKSRIDISGINCETMIIQIFDSMGKTDSYKIKTNNFSEFVINRSDFHSGLYYYRVICDEEVVETGKFTVI